MISQFLPILDNYRDVRYLHGSIFPPFLYSRLKRRLKMKNIERMLFILILIVPLTLVSCYASNLQTLTLARDIINQSREIYNGNKFYHCISEFQGEVPRGEWFILWIDDVFFMHLGFYDFDFLKGVIDTLANATLKYGHTPCRLNVSDLSSSDLRPYGALYFNIMVYNYVKVTGDFKYAENWKEAVLKNHEYIKNRLRNNVYYQDEVINLQPDFVNKNGYITDMTIYYLHINTSNEFKEIQNALISKMWRENKGFFVDWIDVNGTEHLHFGTEQLWGIVLDVLPPVIQQRMFEVIPKNITFSGRFWLYAPYHSSEKKRRILIGIIDGR